MPTRTARTAWDGGFEDGSGQVELTSSGLGTFEMSFPKRSSEDGGGVTNPEELLGAAHSACYTMQLTAVLETRRRRRPAARSARRSPRSTRSPSTRPWRAEPAHSPTAAAASSNTSGT